jgi:hypothetical protein
VSQATPSAQVSGEILPELLLPASRDPTTGPKSDRLDCSRDVPLRTGVEIRPREILLLSIVYTTQAF